MMMKAGFIMDENMSNLTTSASGEASASSGTRNENFGNMYHPVHSSFASTNQAPAAAAPKKKRSLPGNPDPDAEVIALSPKSLMARNRFMCEICNKGFQRDQNLQLHRRGHNLPWKLKQRPKNEVIRKKVYVCPEATCVHHDPSRALGDLTGIKKHFSRKHGEKKWKCEKCSKRYAVQSDWKAHSKICGTREYRCDCGTLFSRRDSFITHRAFCDALAEESARRSSSSSAIPPNYPLLSSEPAAAATSSSTLMINLQHNLNNSFQSLPPKTEQDHHHHHLQNFIFRADNNNINSNNFPPWLSCPPTAPLFSNNHDHQNPNHPRPSPVLPPLQSLPASPHMSATALLQKASQMGVTNAGNFMEQVAPATTTSNSSTQQQQQQLMHDMMSSFEGSACFDEDQAALINNYGMLMDNNPIKREINGSSSNNCFGHQETSASGTKSSHYDHHRSSGGTTQGHQGGSGGGNEGLTRDFLGLRSFSHKDFFNIAGLEQMNNSSSSFEQHQNQNQTPWHG